MLNHKYILNYISTFGSKVFKAINKQYFLSLQTRDKRIKFRKELKGFIKSIPFLPSNQARALTFLLFSFTT